MKNEKHIHIIVHNCHGKRLRATHVCFNQDMVGVWGGMGWDCFHLGAHFWTDHREAEKTKKNKQTNKQTKKTIKIVVCTV